MCFQLECFPMLREETERIVTSHIRDRESRAKDQVTLISLSLWTYTLVFEERSVTCTHTHMHAKPMPVDIFPHIEKGLYSFFHCNVMELQTIYLNRLLLIYILYNIKYI